MRSRLTNHPKIIIFPWDECYIEREAIQSSQSGNFLKQLIRTQNSYLIKKNSPGIELIKYIFIFNLITVSPKINVSHLNIYILSKKKSLLTIMYLIAQHLNKTVSDVLIKHTLHYVKERKKNFQADIIEKK